MLASRPKKMLWKDSDALAKPTLLPDPTCLHLQLLDASETMMTAMVTTTSQEAECPLCHGRSAWIYSRSVHSVADLPWMSCAVRLELLVCRFFCPNPEKRPIYIRLKKRPFMAQVMFMHCHT